MPRIVPGSGPLVFPNRTKALKQKIRQRRKRPPRPPVPGSINIPGVLDDWYEKLVTTDPLYKQELANINAAGVQSASQRRQAIQAALIRFGMVPEGLQDPYGDVDALTRGLAESSTKGGMSTYAQLERQAFDARRDLAARGILRSGEEVFQGQEATRRLGSAEQDLLEYLRGYAQSFAQGEQDRAGQTGAAAQAALERQMALPQNVPPSDRAGLVAGTRDWYRRGNTLYSPTGAPIDIQKAYQYNQNRLRQLRAQGLSGARLRNSVAYRKLQILRKYL